MDLSINNVINISVSAAGAGIGEYNTSNLALFSRETPNSSFGVLGYKIYLDANDVATDFGSASNTYAMALGVFSQQPNILANSGYLVVIPFLSSETLSAAIARTEGLVQYFGVLAVEITSESNNLSAAAVIQSLNKIMFVPSQTAADVAPGGMLDLLRSGSFTQSRGLYYGSAQILAVQTLSFSSLPTAGSYTINYNSLNSGSLTYSSSASAVQTAVQTITGLSSATVTGSNAIGFTITFVGVDGPALPITISPNTMTDADSNAVVVTVGQSVIGVSAETATQECLVMASSYAGRALSVNFNGSDTTQTMHLKDLLGVQPDPSMTQTLLNECIAAGADSYPSIAGVAKVFTSGANKFFDQVYNLQWFVGALQVAGFNLLAQTGTKLPQTENGMTTLKGAYRQVCEQAVANQYLAPGTWDLSTTFGNQINFFANISQRGYYIYSSPVAQQLASVRDARQAPLVQIAVKEAGAVQESSVLIYVNA